MSSEDASVVMLRLPEGQGQPFPFPAQVEVPASAGKQAVLNARVDDAVRRWCEQNDWTHDRVVYSTEVDEDGVKRRIGRFTVTGFQAAGVGA